MLSDGAQRWATPVVGCPQDTMVRPPAGAGVVRGDDHAGDDDVAVGLVGRVVEHAPGARAVRCAEDRLDPRDAPGRTRWHVRGGPVEPRRRPALDEALVEPAVEQQRAGECDDDDGHGDHRTHERPPEPHDTRA